LWFAGRRITEPARKRAIADTKWFFENRETFLTQLHADVRRLKRKADREQLKLAIRLNVASDLDWTWFVQNHTDVTFYDYTKSRKRFSAYLDGKLPDNYYLTYSVSERDIDDNLLIDFLDRHGNVAMVRNIEYRSMGISDWAKGSIPRRIQLGRRRFKTFDADLHDLRLPSIDGSGKIGVLRLKGSNQAKRRAIQSGFARGRKTQVASVVDGSIAWQRVRKEVPA